MKQRKPKDKMIAELKINGAQYSIRATAHAVERMAEREVDQYVVAANVMALGKQRLLELQEAQAEAIVIDEDKNIAVVIGFKKNRIQVITVINKANVFVKKDTVIERI